jgi:hypothetical protein
MLLIEEFLALTDKEKAGIVNCVFEGIILLKHLIYFFIINRLLITK